MKILAEMGINEWAALATIATPIVLAATAVIAFIVKMWAATNNNTTAIKELKSAVINYVKSTEKKIGQIQEEETAAHQVMFDQMNEQREWLEKLESQIEKLLAT